MFPTSAARSYAKALLATASPQDYDRVREELDELRDVLASDPELARILGNPALPVDRRAELAQKALAAAGASPPVQAFVAVLVRNGHLHGAAAIASAFADAVLEARGIVRATVRTAHALSAEQRQAIATALGKATGKQVEIGVEVDPDLVGGFVARAGDLVFDGSIARQLDRMRGALRQG